MPTLQIDIVGLPPSPLDAAADFHSRNLPQIRDDCAVLPDHDVLIVFEPASHAHRGWRLAAVQQLAREASPRRVNALVSEDRAAILAALAWLERAAGVTGQVFELDGLGAGPVI